MLELAAGGGDVGGAYWVSGCPELESARYPESDSNSPESSKVSKASAYEGFSLSRRSVKLTSWWRGLGVLLPHLVLIIVVALLLLPVDVLRLLITLVLLYWICCLERACSSPSHQQS